MDGARSDTRRNAAAVLAELAREGGTTVRGIAERTGLSVRTVNSIIALLKSRDVLVREGSARSGRWVVHWMRE